MGDAGEDVRVSGLKDALPSIDWHTPNTDEFKARRVAYFSNNAAVPQAIICPRDAGEVSSIVHLARQQGTPFTVRTGGHDAQGRSIVDGILCIDMRALDSVQVADDRKSAVIGGGVCMGKLATDLNAHGLTTPHGSVSTIGYVGWSTLGGYGCTSRNFGLGVDQILEVEVVNNRGEIVKADTDMLTGIRGAGGNFGVVTSLRIKVYEMNKLLAGMVLIDTSRGITQVFKKVILAIQDLESKGSIPKEVVLEPMVMNHPQAGRCLGISYVWSSDDADRGRKTLEDILGHLPGPVVMNSVDEISPPDWINMLDNFVAKTAWGGSQAISFGQFSSHVLDIIGQGLEEMPSDPGTCFILHMLSQQSPSVSNQRFSDTSCFSLEARQPHTLVETIGCALTQDAMDRCVDWARSMREALFASGEAMKGTYVSLVSPEAADLEAIYGEKMELLRSLKQKYDPDGIFKYTVPRLVE